MVLWVETEARRANRNLLVCNLLIIASLIAIIAVKYRYCANFVMGCQRVSNTELVGMTSPEQRWRNFVTVNGTKAASTGYRDLIDHVEGGRVVSTEIKDEYFFLRVGEKLLLVKAEAGREQLEYSGELEATTERVSIDLLRPLAEQQPELAAEVLPFTLNAADFRNDGYLILGLVVPLFALAGWNCLKGLRRNAEPQSAPIWKTLASYGNAEQLSQQIEAELQQAGIRTYRKLQVTPQWMVRRRWFSTWVSPIADLVWVYKKVTKHSVNFIPTGKTYSVVLTGRHRQRTEEQMKEKVVNELLTDLATRVPWVLFGFDKNLEQSWKKDPASVIATVDSRAQQHKAKAAGA
jgi:hypothetical protein